MRVVIDTNVLASGAVAPLGGAIATIVEALRSRVFDLVLSDHILDELTRTLAKSYFTRRVSPAGLNTYVRRSMASPPILRTTSCWLPRFPPAPSTW
ncbi:MAG: PIN domain-containing protein [Dehalococcoidia bacterium]|nr:PIN domain-containing protein [Dehalococcoidia bacterium]